MKPSEAIIEVAGWQGGVEDAGAMLNIDPIELADGVLELGVADPASGNPSLAHRIAAAVRANDIDEFMSLLAAFGMTTFFAGVVYGRDTKPEL